MPVKPLKIIIVEDSDEFSDALRKVLNEQTDFPCEVVVINPADPAREKVPTFEEINDEIDVHTEDSRHLVLMDNQLGTWKWTGAHLAPSFHNLLAISTDEKPWAKFNFTRKTEIAYRNKEEAKKAFLAVILVALHEFFSPGVVEELYGG